VERIIIMRMRINSLRVIGINGPRVKISFIVPERWKNSKRSS